VRGVNIERMHEAAWPRRHGGLSKATGGCSSTATVFQAAAGASRLYTPLTLAPFHQVPLFNALAEKMKQD
jgi:hypothetical protein